MSQIPDVYLAPLGAPLNWHDEESGVLRHAVLKLVRFLGHGRTVLTPEPDPDELELLGDYIRYYIAAPCWDANPHADDSDRAELAALREESKSLDDCPKIKTFLGHCLKLGLDPL
jgi:hypothetical protein